MRLWRNKSGTGTKPRSKAVLRVFLTIAAVLAAAAVGLGLLVYWIGSSFDDMCGNDQVVEVVSPNDRLKAVTFRRDCGATTGYSTQLSILPIGKSLPNSGGNVFISHEDPEIKVQWIDDRRLKVSGFTATQLLHLSKFENIEIIYE